jgi:CRP/FNR family cyclic AMP-dependent transcriptional regulator
VRNLHHPNAGIGIAAFLAKQVPATNEPSPSVTPLPARPGSKASRHQATLTVAVPHATIVLSQSPKRQTMDDPILTIEEREAINRVAGFHPFPLHCGTTSSDAPTSNAYKDGDLIAARGDPPEEWIACAKGAVRVSSTSISGKQITLTYVEPGIWFGDVAIFDGDRRTHDAYAHGDTTILCVARGRLQERSWRSTPSLYEAMLRLHARRIRQLFGLVEDLNTLPLRARLAKQLVHLVRSYGVPSLSTAAKCASACNWRRKNWRNCWAPRASA